MRLWAAGHLPRIATGCDRWALSEEGPRVKSSLLAHLLCCSRTVGRSSLSWPWLHTVSVGAVPASQFHKGPSGGQSQAGACRDRGAPGGSGGGLEGLVAGEDVPGGEEDLARDGGFGRVAVTGAAADVEVEVVPGVRLAPGLLGGLDRRPAEQARARLAEWAAARSTLTGLVDAWGESTVGDELLRTREAADLADLGRDGQGEQLADAGDRVQQHRARVGLGERPQLGVQRRDPGVEEIDQRQALAHRAAPDLGDAGPLEQRQAVGAAQARQRDADAPLRLQTEDAPLGAGSKADQVHPPAQPFPQRPLIERGQPERGHELGPGEFGQQTRVDLVGLRRQRRHRLYLACVRDLHLPAAADELVANPERAAHHLQAGPHLIAQFEDEPSEPVPVSSDAALAGELTARGKRAPLRLPIRPIESDILHHGPPSRWDWSPESVSGEEALLHDIP